MVDTRIQDGEIPIRLGPDGTVLESGRKRETREFHGRSFLMETALTGDIAILRAWKADEAGNCVFRYVIRPTILTQPLWSPTKRHDADIPRGPSGPLWLKPLL